MNASHYVLRASTFLAAALVFVTTPAVAQDAPTSLLINPYPNKVEPPKDEVLKSIHENANKAEMRAVEPIRRARPVVSEVSPRMVTNMDTGVSAGVVSGSSGAASMDLPVRSFVKRDVERQDVAVTAVPEVEDKTTRQILDSVVSADRQAVQAVGVQPSEKAPLKPAVSMGAGNPASPAYRHEQAVHAAKSGGAVSQADPADLPPVLYDTKKVEPTVSAAEQVSVPLLPSKVTAPAKVNYYSNAAELGVSLGGNAYQQPKKVAVQAEIQPQRRAVSAPAPVSSALPLLGDDSDLIQAQAPRYEDNAVAETQMIPVTRLVPKDRRYGEHVVPIEERNVLVSGQKIVTKVEQAEPVLRSENLPQAQTKVQQLQASQPQPVLRQNYARRVIDTMNDAQPENLVRLPPADVVVPQRDVRPARTAEPAVVSQVVRMQPVIDDAVIVPGEPRPIERVNLMPSSLPSLSAQPVPAPSQQARVVPAVPAVVAGGEPEPILFDVDTGIESDEFALQRSDLDRQFAVRREWKSLQGYDLREVLYAWSQQAGVTLVWDTGAHFSTLEPLRVKATYSQAVQDLLDQYHKSARRPVGKIYSDPRTGERYLVVSAG